MGIIWPIKWFSCASLICCDSLVSFFIEWRKWSNLTTKEIQSLEEMVHFDQKQWQWFNQQRGSLHLPRPSPQARCSDPNCPGKSVESLSSHRGFPPNNQHSLFGENYGKFVERALESLAGAFELVSSSKSHAEELKGLQCPRQGVVPSSCDPQQKSDG